MCSPTSRPGANKLSRCVDVSEGALWWCGGEGRLQTLGPARPSLGVQACMSPPFRSTQGLSFRDTFPQNFWGVQTLDAHLRVCPDFLRTLRGPICGQHPFCRVPRGSRASGTPTCLSFPLLLARPGQSGLQLAGPEAVTRGHFGSFLEAGWPYPTPAPAWPGRGGVGGAELNGPLFPAGSDPSPPRAVGLGLGA